ncbi:MAG: TOMM precursor leader peptide-binding protein [Acidimicrobiia bacterium]
MTTLQDSSGSDGLGVLFTALREPKSLLELTELMPLVTRGEIAEIVADLLADGILMPSGTPRYQSHSSVVWKNDNPAPTICVLGSGTLATRITSELAAVGIVETTTKSPQSHDELRDALASATLAIVAVDALSPTLLLDVDAAARETGTRWLPSVLDGSHAFIGPWIRPFDGPCYQEVLLQLEATTVRHAEYLATRDHPESSAGGAPSPHLAVAAGWTAIAVMSLIGGVPSLADRVMVLDLERLGVDTTDIMQLPRCPVCQTTPPMHTYQ